MPLTLTSTTKGTLSAEDTIAVPLAPSCFPGLIYPSQDEGERSTNLTLTSSTKGTLTPA